MYLKVKVTAGARTEKFVKIKDDTFEIAVKEKPENNKANKRILELVAGHYGIPVARVRIINGHHSPSKMLSIMD